MRVTIADIVGNKLFSSMPIQTVFDQSLGPPDNCSVPYTSCGVQGSRVGKLARQTAEYDRHNGSLWIESVRLLFPTKWITNARFRSIDKV